MLDGWSRRCSRSLRPRASRNVRIPSAARISRTSCAMFSRYWASARGSPSNTSALVVSPAGHLMLQFLAITHLSIINAVVPNSKLSAPSSADLTTSLAVWCAPEQRNTTFCRIPLAQSA
ncbi:Uncharacterised protein [Mycobacteroides abscessus subsp. abscessus]|nr:Uncharacterised protein [Mycobacteroides abscessus subsp. abscessus]